MSLGETFTRADAGRRRRNWRLGCDEECRILDCEACSQEFGVWEPDELPEPGFVWSWRCPSCGSMIVGRRDGEDPLRHAEAPLNAGLVMPGAVR